MKKLFFNEKGTTLFELMVVILIIAVLGAVAFVSLFGRTGQTELTSATQQAASLLREARSRSVSQTSSTSWGVHFGNTSSSFYALFYSSTYAQTTTISYYRLPPSVIYATASVPSASSLDITFSQLSGLASVSTSVTLYSYRGGTVYSSSTINIASSGAVSF